MNTTAVFPRMHVSYYVSDITKTVAFYNAFFGQEPAKQKPDYAKYVLDSPSLIISFVQNPERVQANFGHLGFQVETVDQLHQRLEAIKANGLPILEEIGTNCCYAMQDKFWVTDPDGVQWEVYYFHADAEFNDPHYQTQEASACCMPPAQADISFAAEEPAKPFVSLSSLGISAQEGETCTPGSGCC
ncbi:glyoxalase/bleomycin resistance/dioxygenase family protein [Nibribacter ruber]|uniref:Glyoxalase/bleomycin resistance/dioxygenase family protein n=1 Tax=Nibribacter ruber TaxID=2698458 RepID=A0A6P1P1J3_9BACT|nr:ArsI/CadI family heavy metal resistance metalloenzyme [Nibribacter ruber]QHL87753.1 glyoxalase/bleomycin resistance/dioxygenase family protein [Nibribacter ruber]